MFRGLLTQFGLLLAFAASEVPAAENRLPPPATLDLERATREHLSTWFEPPEEGVQVEAFHPIGWSQDRRFMFAVEPPSMNPLESEGYVALLVIQNLRTDEAETIVGHDGRLAGLQDAGVPVDNDRYYVQFSLARRLMRLSPRFDFFKRPPPASFVVRDKTSHKPAEQIHEFWLYLSAGITALMADTGIESVGPIQLERFPLRHGDDVIRIALDHTYGPESTLYPSLTKVRVRLLSRTRGEKTIYEETHFEDWSREISWDTFNPVHYFFGDRLDAAVIGYIKNPYAPQIAVLLQEVWAGSEGHRYTMTTVIGATLDTSFRQANEK